MKSGNTDVAELMQALRAFLKENDMMAYLTMMCNRLLELHRVLKPTGSLYLHCDPTASHYLKIVLDGVFGKENFRNEIIWRRTGSHNSSRKYGPIHDVILFFTKSKDFRWNKFHQPYSKRYVEDFFKKEDARGKFRSQTLTGSGTRKGHSGDPWSGYDVTTKGRHWAFPGAVAEEFGIEDLPLHEKLDFLREEGMISMEVDGLPEYRQYLHNSKGTLLQDIWAYQPYSQGLLYATPNGIDEDVKWLEKRGGGERLGYPTQNL
ncbi:MAG: site-specific DNA-methyltransferase [Burkholderiales bacterium]